MLVRKNHYPNKVKLKRERRELFNLALTIFLLMPTFGYAF